MALGKLGPTKQDSKDLQIFFCPPKPTKIYPLNSFAWKSLWHDLTKSLKNTKNPNTC